MKLDSNPKMGAKRKCAPGVRGGGGGGKFWKLIKFSEIWYMEALLGADCENITHGI